MRNGQGGGSPKVQSLDIDAPLETGAATSSTSSGPSAEQISMLVDMGFSPAQARKALRMTVRPLCSLHHFCLIAEWIATHLAVWKP
jgi:hypothetical protein